MSKNKKFVVSEIDANSIATENVYSEGTYFYNEDGRMHYSDGKASEPVIEPGVLFGSNADSGDGYGYDTIKLIPHTVNGNIEDNRYLIVDPTYPNHIHIRAGGNQDNSNAELILGGEKNFVKVDDQDREVVISARANQTSMAHLNLNTEASDTLLTGDVVSAIPGWNVEVNGVMYYIQDVQVGEGTAIYAPGAPFQPNGVYNVFSPDYTNEWRFDSDGTLYGPEEGALKVAGIYSTSHLQVVSDGDMTISSNTGDMNFYMDGGMYIGHSDSNNQIIKRSDLNALPQDYFQAVRWTPNFTATGLTFTGTDNTHPTYQSYYVKQGQLVSFWIAINCATVTSFGTGQLKVDLPFAPLPGTMNHFSGWVHVDETANPDLAGHIIVNADHLANVQTLDLHYIKSDGGANSAVMEAILKQGTPVTLTTATNIYINGTYICE